MRYWQAAKEHPFRFLLALVVIAILIYTFLFQFLMRRLEHQQVPLFTAFFWTISYLTTTGYSGGLPLDHWTLQLLAVLVQFSGLFLFFLFFPLVILPLLTEQLKTTAPEKLDRPLQHHVVIFGFNQLVEKLLEELTEIRRPVVLVDNNPEVVKSLVRSGRYSFRGDSTREETQLKAGVKTADVVIANLEGKENANVVLTAASLGAKQIIALIDDIEEAQYYRYAGADKVISPKRLLGSFLARKATTSLKDELFGENEILAGLDIMELPVYPGAPLDGTTIAAADIRRRTGAMIVAVWHRGKLQLEPGPDTSISAENVIMAVGTREQLLALQRLTRPDGVREQLDHKHFIIAGYGDVGRQAALELRKQNIKVTIIDSRRRDGDQIVGDATKRDVLIKAGIKHASTLIVAGHIDESNIFITLLARRLNPALHILARANHQQSIDKLYRAGADFVFSLAAVAGHLLAKQIKGDEVLTLAEGFKVLTAPVNRLLAGRTIGQLCIRSRTGCTIIGLKTADKFIANPGPESRLHPGDIVVAFGSHRQVDQFRRRYQLQSKESG